MGRNGGTTRRTLLRGAAGAAGAALAGAALSGCGGLGLLAEAAHVSRPADLTLFVLGGKGAAGPGPGGFGGANFATPSLSLADLVAPLQQVVNQARQAASGVGTVTFQTGTSDASSWFPLPSTMYNVAGQQATHTDDPSIPMPDVVVCLHPQMDNYLANRALDLGPYVREAAGPLQGIPATVLREGLCYAVQRGTIQAALPLLRNPPVCLVPSTVTAAPGGKPWSVEAFGAALARAAGSFVQPNAPLLFLPGPLLAPAAVLGSGGTIAQSSTGGASATFASGGAVTGLETLIGWAGYGSDAPFFGFGRRGAAAPQYAFWVGDGRTAFLAGRPPALGFGRGGVPAPAAPLPGATWQIAPLPAFPSRAVVPMTDNVDVFVFLHTAAPAAAASFALQLVSEAVQANLLTARGGLALRPAQAQRQLQDVIGNVQGAAIIASGAADATEFDWMGGPENDANTAAWQTIESDLTAALDQLMGARDGDFSFGAGGPRYPALPSASQVQSVLQAAQAAANSGQPYIPPTA
jgi:hypothetical protein